MSARRKPMSEINVVPYIDVMLVLLVIFMATAPLLTQGVQVDLPKAPSEPIDEAENDPLVISMRADGAIFLNLGMTDADDEGTRVTVFSLEEQAGKVLRARPEVPVYVKADHTLDYGKVVGVMTVLQKAGAESVGLITDPPELGSPGEGP
jgi:biopolymer transport protein TolR